MKRAKLWIILCSTALLSGCSLFEAPALEKPVMVVAPDGRSLIEKGLNQLMLTSQGTFKLSADMKMISPTQQDALGLNLNGQFDQDNHAIRGQGTFSIDIPTSDITSTDHTRGIANIDTVSTSTQILFRLISTQFSGPESENLNTNVAPLSNIWFTLPGSGSYWPIQKALNSLFPTHLANISDYLQYLQINDISLVQTADEKAYQVAVSLDTEKLLAYLKQPETIAQMDAATREEYLRLLPLLQWQGTIFLSQDTGMIKNMFGTIALQGQLNSSTSIAITYKLELQSQALTSPLVIPAPQQVIDSQQLLKILSSGQ